MRTEDKTKEQLISELGELRQLNAELEALKAAALQPEQALGFCGRVNIGLQRSHYQHALSIRLPF